MPSGGVNSSEDCLECRLVSGFGFIGIGSYIIFQARQMKSSNKIGMSIFGSCFGFLGLCRLLGINPIKRFS